ncbi:ABC transporter permease [Dethiobacter alkaliphilus]|uniref:ABC-2 type transporter n=1 Tax=Dethiobacter alkaliphilus AHT 1 TaxID=555088 RepID=C0GCB4_DETAL|nr:ABC transporter permease [Dethiobacter alkaliphilus]EEG78849.1 ABC-2 type transporter [Dethiobacter alkaliphilus AHT 1]
MVASITRIKALVKKESKDLVRNPYVLLPCLLPVALVLMLSNSLGNVQGDVPNFELLKMGIDFNLIFISVFAISMLIAEEKEKNTLRTLMLSAVSPLEFLAGKAVVIAVLTTIANIIMYLFVGMDIQFLPHFFVWSSLVTVVMILLGSIIGLLAQNQVATSVLGTPVIVAFLIVPMLAVDSDLAGRFALLLPNHNLELIIVQLQSGGGYANLGSNIFTILAWIIVSSLAFCYVYNTKRLD